MLVNEGLYANIVKIIVEDEDGEVVKKYELPSQKAEGQANNDLMATSLKYMGMGGLVKQGQKSNEPESGITDAGPSEVRPQPAGRQSTFSGWGGFNKGATVEGKKKNSEKVEEMKKNEAEEDRKIRFTIGGEGRRMTKEDFLNEVRKMDAKTKRQVLEDSNAPPALKAIAKQQGPPPGITVSAPGSGTATPSSTGASKMASTKVANAETARGNSNSPARAEPARGRTTTAAAMSAAESSPEKRSAAASSDTPETAVERRRRLAALSGMEDEEEGPRNEQETPAERRRREAALGVGSPGASDDSDSEDDNTARVPPTRRGIRFADTPARGRK